MNNATNNSVLGIAPLGKTLPVVGIALIALFVLMKPEASIGLSFFERLVFWSLHVGIGLAGIAAVSRLARPRWYGRLPLSAALLFFGLAGAAFLAPAYVALEHILPSAEAEMADSFLDRFAERGLAEEVIVEFLEVTPLFLAAWFAVNLPLLLAKADTGKKSPDDPHGPDDGCSNPAEHAGADASRSDAARAAFLARLPRAIGQDIVAISSDMHYLHVYTTLGKCMILGALRDAAEALGLEACIDCGCCDFVCPSHIPLVSWFRYAKGEVRQQSQERAAAERARQRFEARESRLERARQEKAERLARRKKKLKDDASRKRQIEAALKRAAQKKEQQSAATVPDSDRPGGNDGSGGGDT